jgi:hypothetical protein
MRTTALRASILVALVTFLPWAADAAAKPFAGPSSGWDHTVSATPTAELPRAQETWRKSDGEMIAYLSDAALSYDEMVAMVKKNVSDNGLKPSMDLDRKCDGRRAHEVELTLGTSTVRQVIVDDAPGVTKLTYLRPQGSPAGADVARAIAGYCGT